MVKKIIPWLIIIIIPGFFYLKTLLPGAGFHDVGELQTAICTLGIAHPPGYPTYILLGKIFTFLLPFKSIAWRVNFMSAFFSLASLVLFFLINKKILKSPLSALIATLILSFSKNFWEYSLIAEMYSLNVFFFLLAIYYLFIVFNSKKDINLKHFLFFFFIIGLAQGNHRSITLITPLIFLFLFFKKTKIFLNLKNLLKIVFYFILGLSIYLFLPLRSLQNPYLNYARPTNWKNFKYLVLAEQFRFLMFTVPLKRIFTERLAWFWHFLASQFFSWGLITAFLGFIWLLWKKKINFVLFILFVFSINTFVWLAYNTNDINRYLTPSVVMIAFFIAAGINFLFSLISQIKLKKIKKPLLGILSSLFFLLIFLMLKTNYSKVDRSKDNYSQQWATAVLKNLKPNAVIISHWGYSGSLWYWQGCEKIRPDVLIADERVILDNGWESKVKVVKQFIKKRPVYTIIYKPFVKEITKAGYNYLDHYWFYEIKKPGF